jgi:hypothetical protein
MTIIVADDFNRVDNSVTLGATPIGNKVWQTQGNQTWGISNNQAYPVSTNWDRAVYVDTGISDNYIYQIKLSQYHYQHQIIWRIASGDGNYFVLQGVKIYRSINDSWGFMGEIPTPVSGSIVKIIVTGNKHEIFLDNNLVHSFTDSAHSSGTGVGFSANSTNTRFDDMSVFDLSAPDSTAPTEVTNSTSQITDDTVMLKWTNPSDIDFHHIRILRDGVELVNDYTEQFYMDTGLTEDTDYTYTIKTVDVSRNESAGTVHAVKTLASSNVITENTVEDFLDDGYAFPVTFGTNPWVRYSSTASNGSNGYIASGDITHSETSSVSFEITVSDSILTNLEIDWIVSSEHLYDFFHIYIDGVEYFNASGIDNGTEIVYDLASGTYTVLLEYSKDNSASLSDDKAYVSEIRLIAKQESETAPIVSVSNIDKSKISDEAGMDTSTITFAFDTDVTEWTVRVNGVDHTTGVVADSGGAVSSGTEIQAVVDWTELYQEGNNRVNIYGKTAGGLWTPYGG